MFILYQLLFGCVKTILMYLVSRFKGNFFFYVKASNIYSREFELIMMIQRPALDPVFLCMKALIIPEASVSSNAFVSRSDTNISTVELALAFEVMK